MKNSLRGRLLLRTLGGAGLVLVLTGLCINWVVARSLKAEFDGALLSKARALSALVEEEDGVIEFESDLGVLTELRPGTGAEFLELRRPDGTVAYRSPSLQQADIAWPSSVEPAPRLDALTLPDGRPGRRVAFNFHARRGSDDPAHAAQVGGAVVEIILAKGTEHLRSQLARLAWLLFVAIAAALVALLLILNRGVDRGLAPLTSLASQIREIDTDDLRRSIRLPGSVDELAPVVETLNELLSRLGAAFEREKALSADVAHELRTPLAGMRSSVEVALLRDRSVSEYQQLLRNTHGMLLHMQALVESLLALTRAEADLAPRATQRVSWREAIEQCWERSNGEASRKGLRVRFELAGDIETVSGRPECTTIIANLLDNAIAHSDASGSIAIMGQSKGDGVEISIRNSGCTLTPEQMSHIFDRFWRADAARTQDAAHHGLGLALVKRLVLMQRGTIEATCEKGEFRVDLKIPSH